MCINIIDVLGETHLRSFPFLENVWMNLANELVERRVEKPFTQKFKEQPQNKLINRVTETV